MVIELCTVQYASCDWVIDIILKFKKGALWKNWKKCAFRLIPIAQVDYDVDKCLPMG